MGHSVISDSLQPSFPSIVENVTVSYGRKAILKCEVENLRNYKVGDQDKLFCYTLCPEGSGDSYC